MIILSVPQEQQQQKQPEGQDRVQQACTDSAGLRPWASSLALQHKTETDAFYRKQVTRSVMPYFIIRKETCSSISATPVCCTSANCAKCWRWSSWEYGWEEGRDSDDSLFQLTRFPKRIRILQDPTLLWQDGGESSRLLATMFKQVQVTL